MIPNTGRVDHPIKVTPIGKREGFHLNHKKYGGFTKKKDLRCANKLIASVPLALDLRFLYRHRRANLIARLQLMTALLMVSGSTRCVLLPIIAVSVCHWWLTRRSAAKTTKARAA